MNSQTSFVSFLVKAPKLVDSHSNYNDSLCALGSVALIKLAYETPEPVTMYAFSMVDFTICGNMCMFVIYICEKRVLLYYCQRAKQNSAHQDIGPTAPTSHMEMVQIHIERESFVVCHINSDRNRKCGAIRCFYGALLVTMRRNAKVSFRRRRSHV